MRRSWIKELRSWSRENRKTFSIRKDTIRRMRQEGLSLIGLVAGAFNTSGSRLSRSVFPEIEEKSKKRSASTASARGLVKCTACGY